MKNKLDKWSVEIDKMDARAREVGVGSKLEFQKQIASLQAKRAEVKLNLESIRQAGDVAWKDLRGNVDTSWKILDKAIHTAMTDFKESSLPGEA
jgi:hypothetical protein